MSNKYQNLNRKTPNLDNNLLIFHSIPIKELNSFHKNFIIIPVQISLSKELLLIPITIIAIFSIVKIGKAKIILSKLKALIILINKLIHLKWVLFLMVRKDLICSIVWLHSPANMISERWVTSCLKINKTLETCVSDVSQVNRHHKKQKQEVLHKTKRWSYRINMTKDEDLSFY